MDDLKKRNDPLLNAALQLNEAEVDAITGAAGPNEDERHFELTEPSVAASDQDSMEDLEERAGRLLNATLQLSEAEVEAIYREARPNEDPRQRIVELAELAAAVCDEENRPKPPQLQMALDRLGQLVLPLRRPVPEDTPSRASLRVLVIDQDADRLLARRKLFSERQIDTEITTSAADGLARLEKGVFHLVFVDYCPSKEEEDILLTIQSFNLQIPVINVRVWANFVRGNIRRLNRELLRVATRLCGKPVPKKLPEKRPPLAAGTLAHNEPLFNVG